MFGFLKRRRLPAGRRPPLAPDERVVAWAAATGDNVVVATNLGLWLPGADERLGWHELHKATWSGRQLALVAAREVPVEGADYVVMEDLPPLVLTLLDPDRVPEQVRVRVNKSIAHTSHHPLDDAAGVRVVGRRVPGIDGLLWTVRYDEGVDAASSEVARQTAELVAWARSGAGPTP
ncbi:hypothetical protein KZZ52_52610 [Dactylosporangium sp. AC04546]|uniref:hypothetical protein n=1 Tax=Dactylosporangium sp. AC04546 TaxID=2862460 RepID=UPI001EDD20B5|nr:hypothetical protein [Dactylosporangium sp. AC04546]WVK82500.1 hypothetical protein KZZ52_52610 [Dactylosporangium sp. AC04546]